VSLLSWELLYAAEGNRTRWAFDSPNPSVNRTTAAVAGHSNGLTREWQQVGSKRMAQAFAGVSFVRFPNPRPALPQASPPRPYSWFHIHPSSLFGSCLRDAAVRQPWTGSMAGVGNRGPGVPSDAAWYHNYGWAFANCPSPSERGLQTGWLAGWLGNHGKL